MTEVQKIEEAIKQLTEAERVEFRRWFAQFDADAWDKQIEADAVTGKLDTLAKEALAEYRSGKAHEL